MPVLFTYCLQLVEMRRIEFRGDDAPQVTGCECLRILHCLYRAARRCFSLKQLQTLQTLTAVFNLPTRVQLSTVSPLYYRSGMGI